MLFILAPALIVPVLLILLLVLLPFVLLFHSVLTVVLTPWQMVQLATDTRMRQNHALEHGTVNVIEERYGPSPLTGFAAKNGFFIRGPAVDPYFLVEAAQIAQQRMAHGEEQLAIHRRCGTSIAAANLVFAVVFLTGLVTTGYFDLWWILGALVLSHLLAHPLGAFMQKFFTTNPDVRDVEIVGIGQERPQMGLNFLFPFAMGPRTYFIHTRAKRPSSRIVRWL